MCPMCTIARILSECNARENVTVVSLQAFKKTREEFRCPGSKLELITDELSADIQKALKQCFLVDEPIAKSLELTWCPDVKGHWLSSLKQGMSLKIVNEKNVDIMAIRMIRIRTKSDNFDSVKDKNARKIVDFVAYSSKNFDFFTHYGVSESFDFNGLGVLPKYRRQGLGTLLMETSLKFVGNLQKPCYIRGSATSNISQKIFEKCGFDTLAEFPYEDYKIDGKVVLDNMGENMSMKVYGKCIT